MFYHSFFGISSVINENDVLHFEERMPTSWSMIMIALVKFCTIQTGGFLLVGFSVYSTLKLPKVTADKKVIF